MESLQVRRVLDLMTSIENQTGKCFAETEGEAFEQKCIDAIDGKIKISPIMNKLANRLEQLKGGN